MAPRIAVLGAGGIGGPMGGLLTRAGHDVVLVDQWTPHVAAMRTDGLHVTVGERDDPEDEFTVPVRAYDLHEVCTFREPFDIVFLACKSYDTRWLAQLIEPHVAANGLVVCVQNSLNNEWIAPIVGPNRGLGCVLLAGGELLEPGRVWKNRPMGRAMYAVGELSGARTPRLDEVAAILGDAGKTEAVTNFWGLQWSKLVLTTFSAALSAMVGPATRTWHIIGNPLYRSLAARLYREGGLVGRTLGYAPVPLYGITPEVAVDATDEFFARLIEGNSEGASRGATNMVQQDLAKGRPTEVVGYFNGLVVRKGRQAGIPTPANAAVTQLFVRLERGELKQEMANLELLRNALDEREAEAGCRTSN
jgi:2-dehydropantoate 2-reductase